MMCVSSDCFSMQNAFMVDLEEDGRIKKKCTTVQDILHCRSSKFKYGNATIDADNLFSDAIIDGIAMIKFIVDLNAFIESIEKDQDILNNNNAEYSLPIFLLDNLQCACT